MYCPLWFWRGFEQWVLIFLCYLTLMCSVFSIRWVTGHTRSRGCLGRPWHCTVLTEELTYCGRLSVVWFIRSRASRVPGSRWDPDSWWTYFWSSRTSIGREKVSTRFTKKSMISCITCSSKCPRVSVGTLCSRLSLLLVATFVMFSSGLLEAVSRGKSPVHEDSGLPSLEESLIINFLSVFSNPEAILGVTDAEMNT